MTLSTKKDEPETLVDAVAKQQALLNPMNNFSEEELRQVIARDMNPILVRVAKRELASRGLSC